MNDNYVRSVFPETEYAFTRVTIVIETKNPASGDELQMAARVNDAVEAYYEHMAQLPPTEPTPIARKTV